MNRNLKRTLVIIAIVVVTLAFLKYRSISNAIAQSASFAPPPESVTTLKVSLSNWAPSYSFVGTVYGEHAVTLKAEVDGRVDKIFFTSGDTVAKGQTLVQLDVSVEQGSYEAALAKAKLAKLELDRKQKLFLQKVISPSEIDVATAQWQAAEGEAKSLDALIKRKSIVAPFNGRTGVRVVSLGQFVTSGTEIVSVQEDTEKYILFYIPQSLKDKIKEGLSVELQDTETSTIIGSGTIQSIDRTVQDSSKMSTVRCSVTKSENTFVPGSSIRVRVVLPSAGEAIIIPSSSISYAPYGDSVYVIEHAENSTSVKQQPIRIGDAQGNTVTITEGLKNGDEIVTSGTFKLHPGAKVQVVEDIAGVNALIHSSPPDT